jgi:hypothetical protein
MGACGETTAAVFSATEPLQSILFFRISGVNRKKLDHPDRFHDGLAMTG